MRSLYNIANTAVAKFIQKISRYGFLDILTFITTNWLIAAPRTQFSMHNCIWHTYLFRTWHSVPADEL